MCGEKLRCFIAAAALALAFSGCAVADSAARQAISSRPVASSSAASSAPMSSAPASSAPASSAPEPSAPASSAPASSAPASFAPASSAPEASVAPGDLIGKSVADVTAAYGEDYTLGQENSQYIAYEFADGGTALFYFLTPAKRGEVTPTDRVTYVSVDSSGPITADLSIGMTIDEVAAVCGELGYSYDVSLVTERYVSRKINDCNCTLYLSFTEGKTLRHIDIKDMDA